MSSSGVLFTQVDVCRGGGGVEFSPLFVCVYVLPHDISNTYAARVTKLGMQLFHDES